MSGTPKCTNFQPVKICPLPCEHKLIIVIRMTKEGSKCSTWFLSQILRNEALSPPTNLSGFECHSDNIDHHNHTFTPVVDHVDQHCDCFKFYTLFLHREWVVSPLHCNGVAHSKFSGLLYIALQASFSFS